MSGVGLTKQLCYRELHGNSPQLFANIEYLQELVKENYNERHAPRISDILLWIAINHPEVLKGDAKLLSNISITNLCFRDSYENIDKLIPTEALGILMKSKVCKSLSKICGYIDPGILDDFTISNVKIALGTQNVKLFKFQMFDHFRSDEITFHLKCRELSKKELNAMHILPAYDDKTIYISNVIDRDVAWVLMAVKALNRQAFGQDCVIKLKNSELTTDGLEELAQELSELETQGEFRDDYDTTWRLGVSSPHIGQTVDVISGYEESQELYFDRISDEYGIDCFPFTEQEYEQEFLCERLQMTI